MTPEVELSPEKVASILLGIDCPVECGGKLQTYKRLDKPIKIACYGCGERVELGTVKIIFESKKVKRKKKGR